MSRQWSRFTLHASRRPWLREAAALLVIAAVWLLFFWRLFTPVAADRVQLVSGDFTQQFLAFRRFGLSEFQQGRWPLWMPCVDSGYPYVADPQSASFYPPALINYAGQLIGGVSEFSMQALQLEAALHILLAALFAYLFLRGEVRSRTAALLGAVVFAFGGYLTGYPVLQLAILEAAAWLPLALWAARRLVVRGNARSVAMLALPLALSLLAGHPQTFMFIVYVTIAFALYRTWRQGQRWRTTFAGLGSAIGLTLLLSAVQLLPSLEFMRVSTRTEMSYDAAGTGFPLSDVVQLIVPGVISHFNALYVGILPLALAVFALGAYVVQRASRLHARYGDTIFWFGVALLALLISFGSQLALFDGLYWFVPGYRLFRDQERHALVFSWAMAVLSAYGADGLLHSLARPVRLWLRREARILIGLLAALGALALLIMYLSTLGADRSWADGLILISIGFAVTAGVFMLRARGALRSTALAAALVLITVLDIATVNRGVNWTQPYDPFPAQPSLAALQSDAGGAAAFRLHNEQRLPGHAACVAGLSEVGGITPIHVGTYQDFVKQVPREVRWQLLNVHYVVTWRSVLDDHLGRPVDAALLKQQGEGKDAIYTYRLNEEHPRAWIVHEAEVEPNRAAIYQALAAPDFDPRRMAYTQLPVELAPNQALEPLSILDLNPDRLVVEAALTTPGLLVLSEVNYPGWTATVNGTAAPIIEVDGLLRGVALPAGAARVDLIFRPVSLLIGLALSVMGLAIWSLLMLWGRWPRQRKGLDQSRKALHV